jgi:tetratricopeptide (TPR) repeat protein
MADTIFINYRREDSAATAGRLHDRLAQVFGRKRIFMDVDQIPAGIDFVAHLNSQVAACNVFLVIIGPHWLDVKNEAGQRRLHQPDDFVAIEIAAALARDIRVIPVLVDGARIPTASELPDPLKPLVRRQAIEVRQPHFGRDAEALVERVREALGDKPGLARWRVRLAIGAAVVAALLLVGIGGYAFLGRIVEQGVQRAELKLEEARKAAEAEVNRQTMEVAAKAEQERQAKAAQAEQKRKADEAEQQRLAAIKAEQDRQAKAAQEAEQKRKADEAEQQRQAALADRQAKAAQDAEAKRQADAAEQQRLAAVKAEQDRQAKAAAAQNAYNSGLTYANKGNYDQAIAAYNESIRLNPNYPAAFGYRGIAYQNKGDYDRAIADFNQAIQLNPNDVAGFGNRGIAYARKGDYDQAIADYNEAIRLDPKNAIIFFNRGTAYGKKRDLDRAIADFNQAIQLNPNNAAAFANRGFAYQNKGDYYRAITDYNEAIRLNPQDALAFCNRGRAKVRIKDSGGDEDIAKAKQLNASVCP